jgi:hypothetical protein
LLAGDDSNDADGRQDAGGEGCIGGPHRRGSAPGSCADCEAADA